MKDNALLTLQQRRTSLDGVHKQIAAVRKAAEDDKVKKALKKSSDNLRVQIWAIDDDIRRLEQFGSGFNISQIKGIDVQVRVLLQ